MEIGTIGAFVGDVVGRGVGTFDGARVGLLVEGNSKGAFVIGKIGEATVGGMIGARTGKETGAGGVVINPLRIVKDNTTFDNS